MTDKQDTNSKGETEALKDAAQNTASQISTPADAVSDGSLDDVSGGAWPYNSTASAAYSASGPVG